MSKATITEAAQRAWRLALTSVSYEIWISVQKAQGLFWMADETITNGVV